MKIAICCANADMIGGAPKLSALLAASLARQGLEVACVSLKRPIEGKSFEDFFEIERWYTPILEPQFSLINLHALPYQNYFLIADLLKKCEREFKPDFVISMLWAGAEVLRNVRARKILYVHFPSDIYLFGWWWWPLFSACIKAHYSTLKKVSKVICNSGYIEQLAYASWNPYLSFDKFDVIYPCIDWERFQSKSSSVRSKRICYVGPLTARSKGLEIVIDAFLKANVKESELLVAGNLGSGDRGYIQLRQKMMRFRDKSIRLIENPSDEEIINIYNSSMVFANFNPLEHFGMSIIEAMASGLPAIVADGGGQRETVIHGINGFRISPKAGNVSDEMAQYMRMLLTDDEVFKIMSLNARLHAKRFDKSEFIKKWIRILEDS